MNDPMIDLAAVAPTPLHPAVHAQRQRLRGVVRDLVAVTDDRLDDPWRWRPVDREPVELRYGFYWIHEQLEAAIAAIDTGRSDAGGHEVGPAVAPLAAMSVARWDLHGVLEPLDDPTWSADPGGGEWTIRRAFGHVVGTQRGYGWLTSWYVQQGVVDRQTSRPPDDVFPPEPTEEEESIGSPSELLAKLDAVVDANAVASAGLPGGAMAISATWSGLPVTVGFRLGRYGSHIREHTIQVDKTLALLGRTPTEVERLVRLVVVSYGRLESRLVARRADTLQRPLGPDGATVIHRFESAIDGAVATAGTLRAATR